MKSSTSNWFADWFNSPYYHILYSNRDYSEAEVFIRNLTEKILPKAPAQVLDLACGKGRHAIFLNKLGYDVIGLDLSEESISYAKHSEQEGLSFDVHDMRKTFPVKKQDVITNLFTSFGYFEDFEDHQKTFKNIEQALKKNGVFVLDFMNVEKVIPELVEAEIKTIQDIKFHISREIQNGWILKNIQFNVDEEKKTFQERVRALSLLDFEKFAQESGLYIDQIYGNYNLESFDSNLSDRLILILKKH